VAQRFKGKFIANSQNALFRDVYSIEKSSFPIAFRLTTTHNRPVSGSKVLIYVYMHGTICVYVYMCICMVLYVHMCICAYANTLHMCICMVLILYTTLICVYAFRRGILPQRGRRRVPSRAWHRRMPAKPYAKH
jgi:hypothetical protein